MLIVAFVGLLISRR